MYISNSTWNQLVAANRAAVAAGWANEGVFATGVGDLYGKGSLCRLLYVGKSSGPLCDQLQADYDQSENVNRSNRWMAQRKNRASQFWQFIEKIDPERRQIAWTNVSKMDRKGGQRPPTAKEWKLIAATCCAALKEEIDSLRPDLIVFATSKHYLEDIQGLVRCEGMTEKPLPFLDGWSRYYAAVSGRRAIITKHPQGWQVAPRDRVAGFIRDLAEI